MAFTIALSISFDKFWELGQTLIAMFLRIGNMIMQMIGGKLVDFLAGQFLYGNPFLVGFVLIVLTALFILMFRMKFNSTR